MHASGKERSLLLVAAISSLLVPPLSNAEDVCFEVFAADVQYASKRIPYKEPVTGWGWYIIGGGPYEYADGYEWAANAVFDTTNEVSGAYSPSFHYYGSPLTPGRDHFSVCVGSLCNLRYDFLGRGWSGVRSGYVRKQNKDGAAVDVRCPTDSTLYEPTRGEFYCVRETCEDAPLGPCAGNPIEIATGIKLQRESDYVGVGSFPLRLERFYSSDERLTSRDVGKGWRHGYERTLLSLSPGRMAAIRHRGGNIEFEEDTNGTWRADSLDKARLVQSPDSWQLTVDGNVIEEYSNQGVLQSLTDPSGLRQTLHYTDGRIDTVTDSFGNTLQFHYDYRRRLVRVEAPGGEYRYEYEYLPEEGILDRLIAVVYPDDTPEDALDNPKRLYHYEDQEFPYNLTGITDENGQRQATWNYDEQGRAISSEHAHGSERTQLTYNADGSTTVTNVLGRASTYRYAIVQGDRRVVDVEGYPGLNCAGSNKAYSYDANGFLASKTDWNGNVTVYVHDDGGLETSRTEAVGTSEERSVTTEWHPDFRLPIRITEPGKITEFGYDAQGRLLERTERAAQ